MKQLIVCFSLTLLCVLFVGCDMAQPQNKKTEGEQPVVRNDPPEEQPAQGAPQDANEKDNTVLVTAAPGMSGKGNYASADGESAMGIITVPISVMFRTQDRLALQQVEYAMNLYKAEHGSAPATHEEFWEKIIVANNLQPNQSNMNRNKLPQLPTGQEYVYDPTDGELKIRKPAQ